MPQSPIGGGWSVIDEEDNPLLFRGPDGPPMYLDEAMSAGMLRDVRRGRSDTQHQAADEIGVTESAFARWERGEAVPQPLSAEALLDYLLEE